MTLHEAIIKVLSDANTPMYSYDIAQIINRDKLYTRKDKADIKSNQITARVNKYPHLFSINNRLIYLQFTNTKVAVKKPAPKSKILKVKSTKIESNKKEGAVIGLMAGSLSYGCLLLIGVALCFTGIGAIIGIPLILFSFSAPFFGMILGKKMIKGRCPYCKSQIKSNSYDQGLDCPGCKKRILIKNDKFVLIE